MYDILLEDRINHFLKSKNIAFESKKMMGGLCYMVDQKMCVGIIKNELMARVGELMAEKCVKRKHCRPMDFTGKPLKGYIYVTAEGIDKNADLEYYLNIALAFNPEAKSSKKKK